MQLDLGPVSLPGKNGGVDFELSQMQRVGVAIPEPINTFDLLDYRRGMGCAQTIDPTRKSEVHTSANGFPLHCHLGLVVSSAPPLHTPVGPPTFKRTVGCAERAGACETARAVHKSDEFPNGSLKDNRCHGCENSPKIHRPSKGFGARLNPFQAFRKPGEFKRRSIRLPDDTPITQNSNNCARSAPAQRLHSIPCAERSGLTKRLDDGNHGVAIQNTGDIVGDSGGEFASAGRLKIGKNDIASSTAYVGECVSVEE
jgi:hypothetical protein